jgi:hypothetical protein
VLYDGGRLSEYDRAEPGVMHVIVGSERK